jgi:hypothetical protein
MLSFASYQQKIKKQQVWLVDVFFLLKKIFRKKTRQQQTMYSSLSSMHRDR